MDLIEKIRDEVTSYYISAVDSHHSEHIKNIATSIVLDKYGIVPGGGFVKQFNKNSLKGAFGKADDEVRANLYNLVKFDYNFRLSFELQKEIENFKV